MTIIDKILLELCAKDVVEDGMPDFTNEKHLLALNEVLVELSWPMEARGELLYTLMEADKTSFVGITKDKKRRYFKDKEALDKAVEAGSVTLPDDKEKEKDDDEKQSSDTKVTDFERPGSEKEDEPKDTPTEKPKSDNDYADEVRDKLYGEKKKDDHLLEDETPHSDRQSKNDVITHGFGGMESATGKKPAPGDAGSAMNEIASGEGAKVIREQPDITDDQLTMVLYKQLCGTALGKENSDGKITKKATKNVPEGVDKKCYTKMKIIAKSARRKHDRAERAKQNLGEGGTGQLIGETKTHEYYGSDESLDEQCNAIDNSNKVLSPSGEEIPKESTFVDEKGNPVEPPKREKGESYREYHKRRAKWLKSNPNVKRDVLGALDMAMEGGGGENPSDTATFITDEKGNLVMMFTSDKATTADQQANSTVTKEIDQKIEVVNDTPIDQFPGNNKAEKQKYKEQLIQKLEQNKQEIDKIEADLKGNLGTTSDLISAENADDVTTMMREDKLADGSDDPKIGRGGRGTKKYYNKVVKSYGGPYIKKDGTISKTKQDQLYWLHQTKVDGDKKGYYPDSKGGEKEPDKAKMNYYSENPPGEKDILKAVLSKTKDSPETLNGNESTLVERYSRRMVEHYTNLAKNESDPEKKKLYLEKAKGFNISEKTEETRRRTIKAERDQLKELNEDMMTLPNGTEIPMGDYLEATNLIDKLHLGQIDEGAKGVYKYGGLMEVNMGGVVVDAEVLKKCLDAETSGEIIENFEVGAPEDEDELIRSTDEFETDDEGNTLYFCKAGDGEYGSDENGFPVKGLDPLNITNDESKALRRKSGTKAPIEVGRVTGRNVFIYAITKDGKRIPIARKSLRTKTGKIGRFATTYVWADEMQACFKDNEPPINEPVTKEKS